MTTEQTFAYRLHNIKYRHHNFILDISDLMIKQNQITTLIGANGAGKTTLLNLLIFLQKPDSGDVYFFDKKIGKRSQLTLRREVALVAQNPYLLRSTVAQNIALGLRFRGFSKHDQQQQVDRVLDMVEISEFKHRLVKELSGGEAQKVSLARALVLQPKVLLLDEPFTHLDQGSIDRLETLLCSLIKSTNITVILSRHDYVQEMASSENVIELISGRQAFQTTIDQASVK